MVVGVILALWAASHLFHRECAYGGGMPGWYRTCVCVGIERLDYDRTALDGRRRTTCVGVITSRACYLYKGGPTVPCDSVPDR
jgi:hypothetical protein